MAQISA